MDTINIIFYMVIGIVFVELALPLLEKIAIFFSSLLEILIGYCNLQISKINVKIAKLQQENGGALSQAIGFQVEDIIEEEDDEL